MGLSSCLKDELYTADTTKSPNFIELSDAPAIPATNEEIYNVTIKSFAVIPSAEFDVTVSYSGSDVAPQDIVVDIAADPTVIEKYNSKIIKDVRDEAIANGEDPDEAEEEAYGKLYDLMPSALYSLSTDKVTIKKGEKKTTFKILVKPDQFDFAYRYGLPITIKSTSFGQISGNFNSIIYAVGAKNKYDGNYEVTATAPFVDITSTTFTGWYPLDADLKTLDANSVVMASNTYLGGAEGHPFKADGGNSYYGSFSPVFIMDNDGNVIRVENYFGQPAANGRSARLNTEGVNKFTINDDGSKTLEVSYIMQGPGFVDRTFFYEKWTFKGDRE